MWTAILIAILTFLLTGVLANWLVHKWQHRNWLNQQRYLGAEKEYLILKELSDEIAGLAAARLYRMHRVVRALRAFADDIVKSRFEDYDKAQIAWNDKLSSFLVRLRIYTDNSMAVRLEEEIQARFVRIGSRLDSVTRHRLSGGEIPGRTVSELDTDLNRLHGKLLSFNREILRIILWRRQVTYEGFRLTLTESTLELFPTWQLFKALFQRRTEPFSIVRTAADIEPPPIRGY